MSVVVGASPPFAVRPVSLAVRQHLQESKSDAIVLAVSGGADSLALAVCALDQAKRLNLPVRAITVDHGMREDSALEAAHVCQFLRSIGANALVLTADERLPNKTKERVRGSLEAKARSLRYGLLGQAATDFARELASARDVPANGRERRVEILTGHTQNDQAETVLLSLARGTSLLGLTGMRRQAPLPTGFVPDPSLAKVLIGRPLLGISREQTEACCQALNLQPVLDPSNYLDGPWQTAAGEPLPRVAIRERILPELSKAVGQNVVPALAKLADRLFLDEQALSRVAEREFLHLSNSLSPIATPNESNPAAEAAPILARLPVTEYARLEPAIRLRVLRRFLETAGLKSGKVHGSQLQAIDALACKWHGQGPVSLPGNFLIRRSKISDNISVLNIQAIPNPRKLEQNPEDS